tara:strand:+ start:381 stop:608 length:228 start_codon:yes stop_codon:yes gene_type:complete
MSKLNEKFDYKKKRFDPVAFNIAMDEVWVILGFEGENPNRVRVPEVRKRPVFNEPVIKKELTLKEKLALNKANRK